MAVQYRVTQTLEGKHDLHMDYPLLPGDIITRESGGTWMKHAPKEADDARWVIA